VYAVVSCPAQGESLPLREIAWRPALSPGCPSPAAATRS